jgi:hypothetical protein
MSSTEKPTSSEPEAANLAKSFEDRLTFPADKSKEATQDAAATPSKSFNWVSTFRCEIKLMTANTNRRL